MDSRKTLFAICAALACGERLAAAVPQLAPAWPAFAAATALAALAALSDVRRILPVVAFAAGATLSARHESSVFEWEDRYLRLKSGLPCEMEIAVSSAAAGDGEWRTFYGTSGGRPVKAVYKADGGERPLEGETWKCTGWLSPPGGRGAPLKLYVKGAGCGIERTKSRSPFYARLCRFRARLLENSRIGLERNPAAAGMIAAMLFGERSAIGSDDKETFAAAGTIHVFAVSGLHVMTIAKILEAVLAFSFVPFRLRCFFLIPGIWFYAMLAGTAPSTVRAAAMATFAFASPLFFRKKDSLSAWALAFIAIHVLDPGRLLDTGNILSFSVMLALALYGRFAERRGGGIAGVFVPPAIAWAAGVPIAARIFGRISFGAVAANIVAVPAACAAVVASAAGTAAGFVSPALAAYLNSLAALAVSAVSGLSRTAAAVPDCSVDVCRWPAWMCGAWYLAMVLAAWLAVSVKRRNAVWLAGRNCETRARRTPRAAIDAL